ncbi:hypothetical protein ISKNV_00012 [Infectious spleen and kidney necrosis virus]|nr:ORF012 [Infectious spleen and kidney necrosis virus]WGU26688.1 hypothetical protein ISKNV_00012 [Infectious spleen and kidney necrosis virus]WOE43491.1 MAG: hypothetical protein [Infectious spleen and kidney necrosis virus]
MSGILASLAGAVLCAACYQHIDKLVAGVRIVTAMTIVILPTWAKRMLAHYRGHMTVSALRSSDNRIHIEAYDADRTCRVILKRDLRNMRIVHTASGEDATAQYGAYFGWQQVMPAGYHIDFISRRHTDTD